MIALFQHSVSVSVEFVKEREINRRTGSWLTLIVHDAAVVRVRRVVKRKSKSEICLSADTSVDKKALTREKTGQR